MSTLRPARGFTLVELMIAMLLGLIIVGVVLGIFLEMLQGYRANNSVGDVQTSSRLAFELLAHDIRHAGLTGCNNDGRVTDIRPSAGRTDWNDALRGYTQGMTVPGLAGLNQVAGTDSIQLMEAADTAMSVKRHTPAAGRFEIDGPIPLRDQGVVIVCDPDHAAILQVAKAGATLSYDDPALNCGMNLAFPTHCDGGHEYTFGPNAQMAPLYAAHWYIGANPANGTSLYRLTPDAGAQEMVRNVTDLRLRYLPSDASSFVPANLVTDWPAVTAVQISLTLQSGSGATSAPPLTRATTATVALYNRVN